ncbi:MAG: hypothetical protein K9K62_00630 [Desulfobacteraceae bacterium]|nr:hypothetical protein [Desulfobacteraceae bacterium]
MDNKIIKKAGTLLAAAGVLLALIIFVSPLASAQPAMEDYTAVPYFVQQASVKPNILIMLDNSGSMNSYVYEDETYDSSKEYYGYFSPDHRYDYGSNKNQVFEIEPPETGAWSGSFLNFLTMRRIDVVRKVLTGGKVNDLADGKGTLIAEEETGYPDSHVVEYKGDDAPPHDGESHTYEIRDDGTIYVTDDPNSPYTSSKGVEVQKRYKYEPEDYYENSEDVYYLGGVMQKFGDEAYWGNSWFVEGSYEGGKISNPIGEHAQFSNMINDIRNKPCDTWTPLAESYYVAMQHFRQEEAPTSMGYHSQAAADNQDPFDYSHWCAKNFVLMLTDGASTQDQALPDYLEDYADSRVDNEFLQGDESFEDYGSDYLKDVAYWARTNDLRTLDNGEEILPIIPYIVFAFEEDPNAEKLLKEAARMGGFEDRDGDGKPSSQEEWDKNADKDPDSYFEAKDGYKLERALEKAILGILNRASSGTSASILSTNEEGEGSMLQAYFNPSVITESGEATWLGYLQSLWIDPCGNIRDDSGANTNQLDLTGGDGADKIIRFVHDAENSETKVVRYTDHPIYDVNNPYSKNACKLDHPDLDQNPGKGEEIRLSEVQPIFAAGKKLHEKGYGTTDRTIFTRIDGSRVDFIEGNDTEITPELGVNDESCADCGYLGDTESQRADNLINFIRGADVARDSIRSRLVTTDNGEGVWKLGDIAHSTPVTVSGPVENYHILYSDSSYNKYIRDRRDRETMVYVGANDGMLHAFTHGKRTTSGFDPVSGDALGTEVWAYIPGTLLPHLKWLADPEYSHVYYVDQKPKVFDAKIPGYGDTDGSGWGTFILQGLRMGGKHIWTQDSSGAQQDYYPTYTLIDVTEPRDPEVVWERSYDDLGMSFSRPAIVKNNDDWYAVFGSGPKDSDRYRKADLEGWTESQQSHVYVVDLETGAPVSGDGSNDYLFTTDTQKSFFNSPVSLDKDLNFNVDAIYLAETYDATADADYKNTETDWQSNLYKINVPVTWSNLGVPSDYKGPSDWQMEQIFETGKPLTSPVSLSQDTRDNIWIYFGTGRFIGAVDGGDTGPIFNDRQDEEQQYLYGIKDPYYDRTRDSDTYFHTFQSVSSTSYDLFDSNSVDVAVFEPSAGVTTTRVFDAGTNILWDDGAPTYGTEGRWDTLVDYVQEEKDGWVVDLEGPSSPSERVTGKPAVIGGIVLASGYTPDWDPCMFGGTSNLYGLYYETGTAYAEHVLLGYTGGTVNYDGDDYTKVTTKAGSFVGAPPPSIGLHAGRGEGASAYLQQSTGEILKMNLDPALDIRSGLRGWRTK